MTTPAQAYYWAAAGAHPSSAAIGPPMSAIDTRCSLLQKHRGATLKPSEVLHQCFSSEDSSHRQRGVWKGAGAYC